MKVRCEKMRVANKFPKTNEYVAFMKKNNLGTYGYNVGWYKMSTKFGRISRLDNTGRGYWFSVDQHGAVRIHHFSSSGFGKS